jgi:exodeoxyribonuclease-5
MAKMQLSDEQGQAVKAVVNWFKGKKQVFELSGPAGTGKTTLAKCITEELGLTGSEVMYCAFTGKAALVLSQKGCNPSSTVHGLIYKAHQNEQTGVWSYSLSTEYIRELGVKLIVLDEAPMLGADIAEDLIYCGVKVLALGDKHQLPPVNGEAYFGVSEPDFLLTEVHRQAADSPIIALATLVRSGGTLKIGNYGDSRVISAKKFDASEMLQADQVLCGKNDTRHYLNAAYRKACSKVDWEPTEGERLICLRNNRDRGFLNGQMFLVEEVVSDGKDVECMVLPIDYPETLAVKISTPAEYFKGEDAQLDWRIKKNCDEFCYAYAISTHKSQGSQWQHVLILDQSKVFKQDAAKHLYTAITRASEKVTVFI